MGKPPIEFVDVDTVPWSRVAQQPGVSERVPAHDLSSGLLTRMVRWAPGLDTSSARAVAHNYFEEGLILSGSINHVRLGQTFAAGCDASGRLAWFTARGRQPKAARRSKRVMPSTRVRGT